MEFKELMEKVAEKNNTTADEVYAEIQKAIVYGTSHSDMEVKKNWEKIPHEKEMPSPEEVISYLVNQLLCGGEELCEEE